jgi:cobalt-zinc-cadmium efflux system membrane fusion protein
LSDEALKVARITIDTAGPQLISQVTNVYGRLVPNQDRVAHIRPRFSGVVREIRKELGDKVEKGEVLAIIESNQSLQPYEIRSQIRGEIIARHATLGEFVTDEKEVFVVADLSEVWADFQVYRDDSDNIERGQPIKVDLGEDASFDAKVTYVAPLTDEVTQSKLVRAVISNPSGRLRPGLFISGSLSSNEKSAALAVRREAIQSFRDWSVVYLTDGKVFQAMPVELGRKDSSYVEVLSGLEAGDRYVSHNSFIIKADIEKSGASHDH